MSTAENWMPPVNTSFSLAQEEPANEPQINQPAVLTCICCRLSFSNSEEQRAHYKTEFHRFNLKRQVANLPPITEKLFNEKVNETKEANSSSPSSPSSYCQFCKKRFTNQSTFEAHVKSKKHVEKAASAKADNQNNNNNKNKQNNKNKTNNNVQSVEEKKEGEVGGTTGPLTPDEIADIKIRNAKHFDFVDCLFCNHKSSSLDLNIEHMTYEHGLFIPDLEYVKDLEGLVKYLGEKVGTGNVCLQCNKMFRTCEAVQHHMFSLSHSQLNYDDDNDEYDDFYDFSKSWEAEGLDPNDPDDDPDKFKQIMLKTGKGVVGLGEDGYSLVLANGTVLGHRDLKVYYKQKFKPKETRDSVLLNNVMNKYRAIGWHTVVSQEDVKIKAKAERQKSYHALHTSVKANKLQKYFRHQVIF